MKRENAEWWVKVDACYSDRDSEKIEAVYLGLKFWKTIISLSQQRLKK